MDEVKEAAPSGNNPVTFTLGSDLDTITTGMAFKAAPAAAAGAMLDEDPEFIMTVQPA